MIIFCFSQNLKGFILKKKKMYATINLPRILIKLSIILDRKLLYFVLATL